MIDIWTVSYIVLWVLVLLEGVAIIVLLRQFGAIYLGSRAAINRDGLLSTLRHLISLAWTRPARLSRCPASSASG